MVLGALVRANSGAVTSKFVGLRIEVFNCFVGDHRVVFDGIFFARLIDHFAADVGAPLRHADCDVEVAEGHNGDDERKVATHTHVVSTAIQFKVWGTYASNTVRKYMIATPKSTNIGTT